METIGVNRKRETIEWILNWKLKELQRLNKTIEFLKKELNKDKEPKLPIEDYLDCLDGNFLDLLELWNDVAQWTVGDHEDDMYIYQDIKQYVDDKGIYTG